MQPFDSASFGDTSVDIFTATSNPIRFIAQCQGQIFNVECSLSKTLPAGIQIHRICMTEDKDPEWVPGQFSAIAVVDDPEASSKQNGVVELVCIDRNYVHVCALDYSSGPRNIHRRIGIGGSPVRALYSKRLRRLIILSSRLSIIRPPRVINGRTHTGARAFQPVIALLDPENLSGRKFDEEDEEDEEGMEVDLGEDSDDASPENQHKTARQGVFDKISYEPGERFLGVTEWFPNLDNKEYHLLAVNTIIRPEKNRSPTGRLLLFNVQEVGDHVTMVLKKESMHRAPIYAVAVNPEKQSLIFQCGEDICVLNLEESPTGPKTVISVKAQLRSPARHITIEASYIYVSTAGDSLNVFYDSNHGLEHCFGDSVARQCLYHLNIPCKDRLLVTVDMGGSLTGFWQPPDRPRLDHSLSTMFEASFPQSIIRLREVKLPRWLKDEGETGNQGGPENAEIEWLTGQRLLVGVSACGTMTQHRLIAPQQWPLLRFLQNLAETSPIICPLREGLRTQHLDPNRISNPQTRAINGDILLRLLERGGSNLLQSLMNRPPPLGERWLDFDSVEDRWARLRELLGQFLMTTDELSGNNAFDESEIFVASTIVERLRRMLQPAL